MAEKRCGGQDQYRKEEEEERLEGREDRDQIRLSCAHVTADVATGRHVTALGDPRIPSYDWRLDLI